MNFYLVDLPAPPNPFNPEGLQIILNFFIAIIKFIFLPFRLVVDVFSTIFGGLNVLLIGDGLFLWPNFLFLGILFAIIIAVVKFFWHY